MHGSVAGVRFQVRLTRTIFWIYVWRFHAIRAENVDKLETQCANVLTNFHNVVFGDAEIVALTLLGGDVASHQQSHNIVVSLRSLIL